MPKYLLCWPGRQGVREKYFTAKGVRNPKSLGTAAAESSYVTYLSDFIFIYTLFHDKAEQRN